MGVETGARWKLHSYLLVPKRKGIDRVPLQYIVDPSAVRSLTSELDRELERIEHGKTETEAPESTKNFRLLRESCR